MTRAGSTEFAAPAARQRIIDTACELFVRRGIRAVGIDEIVDRTGVAKATLYRHFPTKDTLALACLVQREQDWTTAFVDAEARRRGASPEGRLLAIFDLFDEWFHRDDYEACTFINVLLEMGRTHALGEACVRHLANLRKVIEAMAEEASLRDPAEFARLWQILMEGAMVAACEGDADAARVTRPVATMLIDLHRSH